MMSKDGLTLAEYQRLAQLTDKDPGKGERQRAIPLLGLAGEAGTLLSEYKKFLRDGEAHYLWPERLEEEIGDILWYLANVSEKFDINLELAAKRNLEKTKHRFLSTSPNRYELYDTQFHPQEQLPRKFKIELRQSTVDAQTRVVMLWDGRQIGSRLTDNAYEDDGYRFHDAFHLAYAAVLGWSPVIRGLMHRKRKSVPMVDEVEDGGRAVVIEEAIAQLAFEAGRKHGFFENVNTLDAELLNSITNLTNGLEVASRTQHDWQTAILAGFKVWRSMRANGGGIAQGDLTTRSFTFRTVSTKSA